MTPLQILTLFSAIFGAIGSALTVLGSWRLVRQPVLVLEVQRLVAPYDGQHGVEHMVATDRLPVHWACQPG